MTPNFRPILIVEDSNNDAFLLQRALERAGCNYPVQAVQNGREALDYLSRAETDAGNFEAPLPRLIFLDLTLPFVSGFEVLSWLATRRLSIPVIVLTASADERAKRHVLQLGASAYIGKPPEAEVIARLVDRFRLREGGLPVQQPSCAGEPGCRNAQLL